MTKKIESQRQTNMGVSKNRGGPPKWMVYFMENPIKMDYLGGNTHIFGNTHMNSRNWIFGAKKFMQKKPIG